MVNVVLHINKFRLEYMINDQRSLIRPNINDIPIYVSIIDCSTHPRQMTLKVFAGQEMIDFLWFDYYLYFVIRLMCKLTQIDANWHKLFTIKYLEIVDPFVDAPAVRILRTICVHKMNCSQYFVCLFLPFSKLHSYIILLICFPKQVFITSIITITYNH